MLGIAVMAMLALAPAKPVMRYVYNGPESARDVRYQYHWEILRTALEKTRPKWGDYLMIASETMTEQRQRVELLNARGDLNVMYLSTTPEFERKLIGIHIPVDKNLGGYCVFLIRDGEQGRFTNVRALGDLRKFTYGLGLGWIDVGILRANHFEVVTGSSYDGLFEMLQQKRFDVFLRAATEVLDEYEKQKGKEKRLAIEQTILLYYPLPMYFWFPKTKEGRRLAARAEEGMRMMIADGTYDQIFDRYQQKKIETLRLKERKLFTITNPNVGPETPFADKKLWFDPQTYR
ncbi:MAG TPA: ABC transporter substrate-binding protein [Thermoanaerobaculia bacterium]|nr:ABC transporter substrate-binding protein [Thermoanaerobaculia bacterium]